MKVTIIGGGLAGCEAALVLSDSGIKVDLFEMKPQAFTPAHTINDLGELVCSNSLKSVKTDTSSGLFKEELKLLDCKLLKIAEKVAVPAGNSLSVDRLLFAKKITELLENNPGITLKRELVEKFDLEREEPLIIATGPLTHPLFWGFLQEKLGNSKLYFYDAIAPVIEAASIDMNKVFFGSRYEPGSEDYLNIPLSENQYYSFVEALVKAEKVPLHEFEKYYEGCLPIEEIARRGKDTLAYGPMKPVGLFSKNSQMPDFAVIQLRRENVKGTSFNLVGFQTKLTIDEQKRLFRELPGLEKAEFQRFGSVHLNQYINSPLLLERDLSLKGYRQIFFAGQITGVEGYVESIASGLFVAKNILNRAVSSEPYTLPETTLIRNLMDYVTNPENSKNFQPMGVNFGLLPPLGKNLRKNKKNKVMAERALNDLENWIKR